MKNILLLVLVLSIVGCGQAKSPESGQITLVPPPQIVSEPLEIATLRAEAKLRHLHFRIWCDTDGDGFDSMVWPDQYDTWHVYIEEGGVPGWSAQGNTQEEVARKLTKLIKRPPNWYPYHLPPKHKKQCPPEVRG